MARCGCDTTCNCLIEDSTCTKYTGDGSAEDPFIINVTVDNQTVFCQGGALEARLNTLDTNTVDLNGTGSAGSPLEAHVIRTPDGNVPGGLGQGNLVKELPGAGGGIYVSCEDVQDCVGSAIDVITTDCLEYDDVTNTISISICPEPNGIECAPAGDPACPAGGLLVFPSSDAFNTLTFGTDNRLFNASTALMAGECMTITGTGTVADPFVITPLIAPEPNGVECVPGQGLLVTPSTDANNGLMFGGDTRLWIDRCPLTLGGSQVLVGNTGPCFEFVGGADCVTPMVATLRLSDDTCQALVCRADGLYVQKDATNLPAAVSVTRAIGARGPFNGTTAAGTFVVDDPAVCITITNPSPCRNMDVSGQFFGFAEVGRTSGEMRIQFKVNEAGNTGTPTLPGPPWFTVSQVGQANPTPPSRQTGNALWTGGSFPIGPGASRTICAAITHTVAAAVNGRIFSAQYTFAQIARWSV